MGYGVHAVTLLLGGIYLAFNIACWAQTGPTSVRGTVSDSSEQRGYAAVTQERDHDRSHKRKDHQLTNPSDAVCVAL